MNINEVADYFIAKADVESGDNITHLKLQKLLYYTQGWHLAIHGRTLFSSTFEAWAHGPVSPEIYARFKSYGWDPIPTSEIVTDFSKVSSGDSEFLDEVWEVYGQFSAKKLEMMTHQESPWLEAREGLSVEARSSKPISQRTMDTYFKSLMEESE
ncbi:Panacea domain-containing protein [Pontibacter sp. JAM-7]|uniref:Panacea domain-containing protein n=1 Tax=Pontibacter sp. JAM-7 TaxID=3366581 RepID=UPI003AF6980D